MKRLDHTTYNKNDMSGPASIIQKHAQYVLATSPGCLHPQTPVISGNHAYCFNLSGLTVKIVYLSGLKFQHCMHVQTCQMIQMVFNTHPGAVPAVGQP